MQGKRTAGGAVSVLLAVAQGPEGEVDTGEVTLTSLRLDVVEAEVEEVVLAVESIVIWEEETDCETAVTEIETETGETETDEYPRLDVEKPLRRCEVVVAVVGATAAAEADGSLLDVPVPVPCLAHLPVHLVLPDLALEPRQEGEDTINTGENLLCFIPEPVRHHTVELFTPKKYAFFFRGRK